MPSHISCQFIIFLNLVLFSLTSFASAQSIQQEALAVHNQFRSLHHAPPLEWDAKLAAYAQHHAGRCQFKHSSSPYGENLAAGYTTVTAGVNAWYREKSQYSYIWPGFSYKTGHFTQLVWRSTTRLGCAFVLCEGKNNRSWHLLVCEYSPHGNVLNQGYFRANVLP